MKKASSSPPSSPSNFSEDRSPRLKKKIGKSRFPKSQEKEDHDESSETKKYLKIINSAKRHPLKYHEYPKLKYKDHIYNLNDTIMVSNCDDAENDFIAILRKIIKAIFQGALYIIVEVQWYYKKSDLPSKFSQSRRFISENEVFLTEHKDLTNVECINGPCSIISFEDYEALPGIISNTFYSRSSYDTQRKRIVPGIEEWTKACICNTPINPDLLYVQCETCSKWFHAECMEISEEEAGKEDRFICPKCRGS